MKPVTICNPVSKNGKEIIDPTAHLTCDQIKDASGQEKFSPRDVVVNNQFGELTLTARKLESLCVAPSRDGWSRKGGLSLPEPMPRIISAPASRQGSLQILVKTGEYESRADSSTSSWYLFLF